MILRLFLKAIATLSCLLAISCGSGTTDREPEASRSSASVSDRWLEASPSTLQPGDTFRLAISVPPDVHWSGDVVWQERRDGEWKDTNNLFSVPGDENAKPSVVRLPRDPDQGLLPSAWKGPNFQVLRAPSDLSPGTYRLTKNVLELSTGGPNGGGRTTLLSVEVTVR